jgi:hypothetical protein
MLVLFGPVGTKGWLTYSGVYENIEKVIYTCISGRVMRPQIRDEHVSTMHEHLPNDLFGYVEQPELRIEGNGLMKITHSTPGHDIQRTIFSRVA